MATQKEAGKEKPLVKSELVTSAEAEVNRLHTLQQELSGRMKVAKAHLRSLLQQGVTDYRLDNAYLEEIELEQKLRQARADERRARAGLARARAYEL